MEPDAATTWPWPDGHYDFFESTRLLRTGRNDPTVQRETDGLWRAARTFDGGVTVRLRLREGETIEASAWGNRAAQALAEVPHWLGLGEAPWTLPPHPVTDRLLREHPGLRLTNTGDVFEALVNAILQQRVTWNEAAFGWRRLIEALGEPAPGPAGLRLLPTPRAVRTAGIERLMRLGMDRQRARTLHEVAFSASRLQRAAGLPTDEAMTLLQHVPGVGPWTAAVALGMRLGRPEPLVLGDAKLSHTVSWALAGEPRGSDQRMAELLAPFDGQAFRVVRLLFAARIDAPRRGPRREVRFGLR